MLAAGKQEFLPIITQTNTAHMTPPMQISAPPSAENPDQPSRALENKPMLRATNHRDPGKAQASTFRPFTPFCSEKKAVEAKEAVPWLGFGCADVWGKCEGPWAAKGGSNDVYAYLQGRLVQGSLAFSWLEE